MGLAPGHQGFASEAAIGAKDDPHPRPAFSDLANNAGHLHDRALATVDVGAAQPRQQQVAAAEHV
jgi:hypothetical protein